jgi:hypothetical protein
MNIPACMNYIMEQPARMNYETKLLRKQGYNIVEIIIDSTGMKFVIKTREDVTLFIECCPKYPFVAPTYKLIDNVYIPRLCIVCIFFCIQQLDIFLPTDVFRYLIEYSDRIKKSSELQDRSIDKNHMLEITNRNNWCAGKHIVDQIDTITDFIEKR